MTTINPEQSIMKLQASTLEIDAYTNLLDLLHTTPIPDKELLANLGLFLTRSSLSRILYMHDLYMKALDVHGIVIEFGARWGQNLALFSSFRNMYEPHNVSRKIVGFDTFAGFPDTSEADGSAKVAKAGSYTVTAGYETYLESLLTSHEALAPRSNLKKFELVKGDVRETLPRYLETHPETMIALAYFDMALYEPSKAALEMIQGYLTKGSVLGFNNLGLADVPGETIALREVLGLSKFKIARDPSSHYLSYVVIE